MSALRIIGVTGLNGMTASLAAIGRLESQDGYADIGTSLVDPPYPYFLEYGTSRMEPRPAARPAFWAGEHEATKAGTVVLQQMFLMGNYSPSALKAAATAMAWPIENYWRRFAPVKTGTYRRSIHSEVSMA